MGRQQIFRHEITYGRDGSPSTATLADAVEVWEYDPEVDDRSGYPVIELVWLESSEGGSWQWQAGMWHDAAPYELRTGEWPTFMAAIGAIWAWKHG